MEKKVFALILLVYILGFCAHARFVKKTVYGDGIFYYSWLRSVTFDRDMKFGNEYAYFHTTQPTTPLHIPGNKYSVGPAALWSPAYLWVRTVIGGNGYGLPYQIAVGLLSVLYAVTGLILLYIMISRYFGKTVSLASVSAIAFASNLLFYGSLDTVNSHAVSFFASALFLTVLLRKQKNWFIIGAALGLIGLIRTQDLLIGLVVLPYISVKKIPALLFGCISVFSLQLIGWQLVNGNFWRSPYLSNIEGFNFLRPRIFGVLFSGHNGLILWTPLVLLAFVGFWIRKSSTLLKLMGITVLIQLYVVASWSIWWQGASFSGRMFVSMLPLLGFGLANFFGIFEKPQFRSVIYYWAIIMPLSVINAILIIYFLLTK